MATKNWTLLRRSILKMNKQRYLSVMQGRSNLIASINSRTLPQNTKKVTDTEFQIMAINNPGVDLHRNGVMNTGMMAMADLPSAHSLRSKDQFSAQVQSGLECRCLTHLAQGTIHEKAYNDSQDDEKTKESLCGLLFNCYVFCLFVLGSYVPME